jgi:CO dehydrogenase/acetyl-CoA synthase gamma subunit (corrinoid Fe-S protein)
MTRELNKKIGSLSDIFGMYAQSQTQGRIIKMFEKRGIELRTVTNNYKERSKAGEFLYEIDILLYNTMYAIVVEVKNHLKKDDIDEHIERMEKCIAFPPRGTEGKILLGAVATMIVSEEVERYATKKGFYVIKPSGKSVKIANNSNFKAAEWATKT